MDYLNGQPKFEILGQPKTVRMQGRFPIGNGQIVELEGPTECWIAAIVWSMQPEQRATFVTQLKRILELREHQVGPALVVADIQMPNMVR
jgi:CheY-like chemotaxis protein